jgi:taurine dioxygenase
MTDHATPGRRIALDLVPLSPVLGAEVRCGNLAELAAPAFDQLRQALNDHLLLLFRGPRLTDDELLAFGQRLGALDTAPLAFTANQQERQHPEIIVISNVKEGGVPIGVLGDAEVVWHSDNSYRETPLSYSLLHALELPPAGGETEFANMYLAWETLPADMQARIRTLTIKHDLTYNSAGQLRKGYAPVTDPVMAPGPHHPVVRTHPDTGFNTLYLGRRPNAYVCGLPVEESEALLNQLWAHATQPRFTWSHTWREGDMLIWDNRCLMHHRNPFDPGTRRVMHRLQFKGTRPYFDPRAAAKGRHPRAVG